MKVESVTRRPVLSLDGAAMVVRWGCLFYVGRARGGMDDVEVAVVVDFVGCPNLSGSADGFPTVSSLALNSCLFKPSAASYDGAISDGAIVEARMIRKR